MEMLKGILKGQEINDGVMPHSYAFQYAVDHIEADGSVDETRLAQIEFALIPCLGYTNEHHARTLYKVVMSQPGDRKSVVSGKGVSVRVDLGGRRIIKKKKANN